MEIHISNSATVAEVQSTFNRYFPYLKIEFFSVPYSAKKALPKSKVIAHHYTLAKCRNIQNEGSIAVSGSTTVNELELELWKNYGLSAQVFRKSGNLWIETSLTDSWTLERQNREGQEMSQPHTETDNRDLDLTDRDKWE